MRACTHTPRERASERGEREREREREREGEKGRESERECAPFFKCVLLITLLAPGKHTPTDPASSAPDIRCRCALPKPCNAAPAWTRPHPARAGTAYTPAHATRDRSTRARACRRPSDGACPPGTAQSRAQEHGTQEPAPRSERPPHGHVRRNPAGENDQRPRSRLPRPRTAPSPRRARPQSAAEPKPPHACLFSPTGSQAGSHGVSARTR